MGEARNAVARNRMVNARGRDCRRETRAGGLHGKRQGLCQPRGHRPDAGNRQQTWPAGGGSGQGQWRAARWRRSAGIARRGHGRVGENLQRAAARRNRGCANRAGAAGKNRMTAWERYFLAGRRAGCPKAQMENFVRAGLLLQPKQLKFAAYCRDADLAGGPKMISTGGGKGSAKTHGVYCQIFADDCQRVPGLKVLILRKILKGAAEQFDDMRRKLLSNLRHEWRAQRSELNFPNGSRVIVGNYKDARDIEKYMGIEYDVINLGEATQLPLSRLQGIRGCLRTSKPHWRPRMYLDTNPGGIGHRWYRGMIIVPWLEKRETSTRHVQVTVDDNKFVDSEYKSTLQSYTGWMRKAYLDGDWDIAAGQFFSTFRREVHAIEDFDDSRAVEWFAALDYGFAHYTVVRSEER